MDRIELGDIELLFDLEKTKSFYADASGFTCDCRDCINYVDRIAIVKNLMNGLDDILGIDLSKDVGQGMDELMPHDEDDHCLYVIPYYINGKCRVKGEELTKEHNGPIWNTTNTAKHRLNENLSLTIINTTDYIEFENAESVLTIWLEFKTPLLHKEKSLWELFKSIFTY